MEILSFPAKKIIYLNNRTHYLKIQNVSITNQKGNMLNQINSMQNLLYFTLF